MAISYPVLIATDSLISQFRYRDILALNPGAQFSVVDDLVARLRRDSVLEQEQLPSFDISLPSAETTERGPSSERGISTPTMRYPRPTVKRPEPKKKPARPIAKMDVDEEEQEDQEESEDSLLIHSDEYSEETPRSSKGGKRVQAVVVVPRSSLLTRKGHSSDAGSSKRSRGSGEGSSVKRKRVEESPSVVDEYVDSDNEEERERQSDLLRETYEEKAKAFERRGESISLRGVTFLAKTRIKLALVPGLLGKVRNLF